MNFLTFLKFWTFEDNAFKSYLEMFNMNLRYAMKA